MFLVPFYISGCHPVDLCEGPGLFFCMSSSCLLIQSTTLLHFRLDLCRSLYLYMLVSTEQNIFKKVCFRRDTCIFRNGCWSVRKLPFPTCFASLTGMKKLCVLNRWLANSNCDRSGLVVGGCAFPFQHVDVRICLHL